jgi:hypothetical protein
MGEKSMKQIIDGNLVELTPKEISALEAEQRKAEIAERRRPLSESEVSRMLIAEQINTLTVDDNTALRMREFYPTWESGMAYSVGFKVQYNERLYRVVQAHTSQDGWTPESVPALYEVIDETHSGTEDDPTPYSGNMELEQGKYYMQDGVIYFCKYGSGIPVHEHLSALTTFVEVTK